MWGYQSLEGHEHWWDSLLCLFKSQRTEVCSCFVVPKEFAAPGTYSFCPGGRLLKATVLGSGDCRAPVGLVSRSLQLGKLNTSPLREGEIVCTQTERQTFYLKILEKYKVLKCLDTGSYTSESSRLAWYLVRFKPARASWWDWLKKKCACALIFKLKKALSLKQWYIVSENIAECVVRSKCPIFTLLWSVLRVNFQACKNEIFMHLL